MDREPVVCEVCGVPKGWDSFYRRMRTGATRAVCHPCRKSAKKPVLRVTKTPAHTQERRRDLTKKATPAELRLMRGFDLLWEGHGVKWEFQKPIGPFFADFAIPAIKLIIEVDGGYHLDVMQQHRDASRTEYLQDKGWDVMRFTNEDVERRLATVILEISQKFGLSC